MCPSSFKALGFYTMATYRSKLANFLLVPLLALFFSEVSFGYTVVISTGGTFLGTSISDGSGRYIPATLTMAEYIKREPDKLKYLIDREKQGRVKVIELMTINSLNMNHLHRFEIFKLIKEQLAKGATGFVIIHGTDTLVVTATLASLFFEGVNIALTGAMEPSDALKSDGPRHLHAAITAVEKRVLRPDPKMRPIVVMGEIIALGITSDKVMPGFHSPGQLGVGSIDYHLSRISMKTPDINFYGDESPYAGAMAKSYSSLDSPSPRIFKDLGIIKQMEINRTGDKRVHGASDAEALETFLPLKSVAGIVYSAPGLGDLPDDAKEVIERFNSNIPDKDNDRKIIVRCSNTKRAVVLPNDDDERLHTVAGQGFREEKAKVFLSLYLAAGLTREEIEEQLALWEAERVPSRRNSISSEDANAEVDVEYMGELDDKEGISVEQIEEILAKEKMYKQQRLNKAQSTSLDEKAFLDTEPDALSWSKGPGERKILAIIKDGATILGEESETYSSSSAAKE